MTYGESFAARQLSLGNFEKALQLADEACAQEPDDPEPVLDRARALQALGRWEDAVAALEKCRKLDEKASVVDDSLVDDTLFSTLVSWSRQVAEADAEQAVKILGRYRAMLPDGAHIPEIDHWVRRYRGDVDTWRKERD